MDNEYSKDKHLQTCLEVGQVNHSFEDTDDLEIEQNLNSVVTAVEISPKTVRKRSQQEQQRL